MFCFVMWFNCITDYKQDPDIKESNHNFWFKGDDIEYDRIVSDAVMGLKLDRMTVKMKFRMNRKRINDIKLDELELPSSDKLLSNVCPMRMADIIFLNSPLIET